MEVNKKVKSLHFNPPLHSGTRDFVLSDRVNIQWWPKWLVSRFRVFPMLKSLQSFWPPLILLFSDLISLSLPCPDNDLSN